MLTATVIGALVDDCTTFTSDGRRHITFKMDCRAYGDQREEVIVDIGNVREQSKQAQYLKKGKHVCVTGTPRAYMTRNGDARILIETLPTRVEFLGGGSSGSAGRQPRRQQTEEYPDEPAPALPVEEGTEIEDGMPF